MAGEIIRKGDKTDHGGTVLEGSLTDICHGKPMAFIGHKVQCPKCKGTFPIVEGVMTTTIFGKGVAVAGMKTACGASLIPSQFTDIVEWAAGSAAGRTAADPGRSVSETAAGHMTAALSPSASEIKESREKSIKRLYWSYGQNETPIDSVSRHYVDLNLHIETENYQAGEHVDIVLANDDGSELMTGLKALRLQAKVGGDNTACIHNVFKGKTIEIGLIS
ncbi:PAAR domain-containing protein [Pseudoduganella lutea]|uniref:PAAR domain-containing protein n=1 Tax=Pseudoduganella lutea TaxID=321985 RepID=A0A4P6L199_9BURK|nr:PAAR domain-containing protein [Pseudoduganella lutea]QBE64945.1 PAAR domain-containing protein [Pseudoduganella lutea]